MDGAFVRARRGRPCGAGGGDLGRGLPALHAHRRRHDAHRLGRADGLRPRHRGTILGVRTHGAGPVRPHGHRLGTPRPGGRARRVRGAHRREGGRGAPGEPQVAPGQGQVAPLGRHALGLDRRSVAARGRRRGRRADPGGGARADGALRAPGGGRAGPTPHKRVVGPRDLSPGVRRREPGDARGARPRGGRRRIRRLPAR